MESPFDGANAGPPNGCPAFAQIKPAKINLSLFGRLNHGNADVLARTDTMTQSEGTKKIGAPARDRGSGLRQ